MLIYWGDNDFKTLNMEIDVKFTTKNLSYVTCYKIETGSLQLI